MNIHIWRGIKHQASGLRHSSTVLMITQDLGRGQIIPDLPTESFLCFCVKQQVQVTVRGATGPGSSSTALQERWWAACQTQQQYLEHTHKPFLLLKAQRNYHGMYFPAIISNLVSLLTDLHRGPCPWRHGWGLQGTSLIPLDLCLM